MTLDGETTVMNIVGRSESALVNFVSLEDYLLGVGKTDQGCEQGGIYNRSMVVLFVHDVAENKVRAMRDYFVRVKAQSDLPAEKRTAYYAAATGPLCRALAYITGHKSTYGNCAHYASMGLREAGLLKESSMWPKQVFIDLYESQPRDNVSVVSFPRVKHAKMLYGVGAGYAGMSGLSMNPFTWLRHNWTYWRLSHFADAKVVVPRRTVHAEVRCRER